MMMTHGTANAFSLGCRCELCSDARHGARKRQPWESPYVPVERVSNGGRCGTLSGYRHGCRCANCRRANNEYRNRYRNGGRRLRIQSGWVPPPSPAGVLLRRPSPLLVEL